MLCLSQKEKSSKLVYLVAVERRNSLLGPSLED